MLIDFLILYCILVILVERDPEPGGVTLVSPLRTSKKTYVELMELGESLHNVSNFPVNISVNVCKYVLE